MDITYTLGHHVKAEDLYEQEETFATSYIVFLARYNMGLKRLCGQVFFGSLEKKSDKMLWMASFVLLLSMSAQNQSEAAHFESIQFMK